MHHCFRSAVHKSVVVLGLTSLAAGVTANEPTTLDHNISTARPSFSAPATTLERGHWQVEAGYQFTSNDDDGIKSDNHTLPQVFLRFGLDERLEANVFWSGYTDSDSNVGDADGANDLAIGLSYQLTPADAQFALATFVNLSLPLGSEEFSSDEPDPSLGIAWSYATDAGPGLFGTLVASSVTDADERETEFGAAIGAAFSLTEKLGTFVEYFGIFSDTDKSAHNLMGGLTYLVTKNFQLDLNAGTGLNHAADDYFISSGFGWRF